MVCTDAWRGSFHHISGMQPSCLQLSSQERAAFLTTPGILMRIATVREDGSPLVTPIWFCYEQVQPAASSSATALVTSSATWFTDRLLVSTT